MSISDTSIEAAKLQITLLQSKTTAERLALTFTLSDMTISLSRRAIRRANPSFSKEEINCRFVELHYGKPLADALNQYFVECNNDQPK